MSSTTVLTRDAIDTILGNAAGGPVAALRGRNPRFVEELQTYHDALFEPDAESAAAFPLADRLLVAVRVASHTRSEAVADWYARLAEQAGVSERQLARARDVSTPWEELTARGAAIRHADLLTTRPATARQEHLLLLKEAGLSPAGILSLSQTVAFVSYQLRLIAGLRAFGAAS
jgi:uncharacterized protein YciW